MKATLRVVEILPEENTRQSELVKLDIIESSVFQLKQDVYTKLMKSNTKEGSRKSNKSCSSTRSSRLTHYSKSEKLTLTTEHKATTAALKMEADLLRRVSPNSPNTLFTYTKSLDNRINKQIKIIVILLGSDNQGAIKTEWEHVDETLTQLMEATSRAI